MNAGISRPPIPQSIIELWQEVVDSAASLLSVPSVMINKLDPPDLEILRSNSDPANPLPTGTRMPLMGLYCEAAAKEKKMLAVTDARKDPVWADSPTAKAGIFAYLGFPLCWPDGEAFGTLCAVELKETNWSGMHERLLRSFKNAVETHLALIVAMDELNKKNLQLEQSLGEVKALRGILPICSSCKKIRDDRGYWNQVEHYLKEHTDVQFSHSLCPDCARKLYPSMYGEPRNT